MFPHTRTERSSHNRPSWLLRERSKQEGRELERVSMQHGLGRAGGPPQAAVDEARQRPGYLFPVWPDRDGVPPLRPGAGASGAEDTQPAETTRAQTLSEGPAGEPGSSVAGMADLGGAARAYAEPADAPSTAATGRAPASFLTCSHFTFVKSHCLAPSVRGLYPCCTICPARPEEE